MKRTILSAIGLLLGAVSLNIHAQNATDVQAHTIRDAVTYTSGDLVVKPVAKNAVRIQYIPNMTR